jgi:glycosyltransferase involved in cell wall biosynthesis
MKKPEFSIIIPTYNSFQNKNGCLELMLLSLELQEGIHNGEIVIVNNHSSDETDRFFKEYSKRSSLNLILTHCDEIGNLSLARNTGVNNSHGDILLFMDDDIIIYDLSIVRKAAHLINKKSFLCGVKRYWTYIGWNREKICQDLLNRKFDYIKSIKFLPVSIRRDTGQLSLLDVSFIAHFGVITRKLFDQVNGFDETYTGWGREDCDLMYRLFVCQKAKFINGYEYISIVHLNHGVQNQTVSLVDNDRKYLEMERKYGKHLIYSHFFGKKEYDHNELFMPV